ncbi:MAG TPA: cellulase family glycosylhydrolase [Cyclobacteriaceae bacterium]|nr:cellulase family glycosylhydrolase [Cyclobacteriaceae bacterium]
MEKKTITRRTFIETTVKSTAAIAVLGSATLGCEKKETDVTAGALPRWRGFNLLEKFIATNMNDPFKESDFAMIAEFGFDFVRLPMSYWCWSDPNDWHLLKEDKLKEIDQAVEFGKQYGVHVSINFHRGPGYSVDRSAEEPFNLWRDAEAKEAFNYHWKHFAERYKGRPNKEVSFNLLNEPATHTNERNSVVSEAEYAEVVKGAADSIRSVDPNRLIIADGLWWGRDPVDALIGLNVAQSTRGYEPMQVSHWGASWVYGAQEWPEPTWPLQQVEPAELRWESPVLKDHYKEKLKRWGIDMNMPWNKERLKLQLIDPWKKLQQKGVGVHVGEFGSFNHTPHNVALGWMRDMLTLWREAGWGWSMWNFRGGFGVLDSDRADVKYEDYKGHKLDREMLELLKEF